MSIQRAAVVHISILAAPKSVIAFLTDMENWKTWAPWVQSVGRLSEGVWSLDSTDGAMTVRFVEPNSFGLLDHQVVPNGSGSELVMVWTQSPEMSSEQFDQDVKAVTDDFARLKIAAEAYSKQVGG